MPLFLDQISRTVDIPFRPKRIISTVPSQTELLHTLGLEEEVIGITKFCVHPESWFRTKTRIGGTKQLNIEKIKSLQPDLIIANKEENVKDQVEELSKEFPIWVSDVKDLPTALEMTASIGQITGKEKEATELIQNIQSAFSTHKTENNYKPRTAYFIWQKPYMTVGGDTFIHQMMAYAGFENLFAGKQRYPSIELEELNAPNCELLLLSSEPFPFSQKHVEELQPLLPKTKILLIDGEMFSWFGSRLLHAPAYFKRLYEQAATTVKA